MQTAVAGHAEVNSTVERSASGTLLLPDLKSIGSHISIINVFSVKQLVVFFALCSVVGWGCATANNKSQKGETNCLKRCEQLGINKKTPDEWQGDRVPGLNSTSQSPCEKKCYRNSYKFGFSPKKKKPDGFAPTPTGH